MRHWLVYFFCIFLTEFSGFLTGMLTRDATIIYTQSIAKPPLSPPPAVFPVAWTVLYALMGIGLARILLHDNHIDAMPLANDDAKESQQADSSAAKTDALSLAESDNALSDTHGETSLPASSSKIDARIEFSPHGETSQHGVQETERHLAERRKATWIYFAQLFFNLGWCYVFFLYQMFGVAFAWLLVLFALVIAMTIVFYKQDKVAGLIQLPYIFWMMFAAYLNAGVVLLNR